MVSHGLDGQRRAWCLWLVTPFISQMRGAQVEFLVLCRRQSAIIIIRIGLITDVGTWYMAQPLQGQLSPKKCPPSHKLRTFTTLKSLMRVGAKVFCRVIIWKNAKQLKQLVCKASINVATCDKIILTSPKRVKAFQAGVPGNKFACTLSSKSGSFWWKYRARCS